MPNFTKIVNYLFIKHILQDLQKMFKINKTDFNLSSEYELNNIDTNQTAKNTLKTFDLPI